MQVDESSLFSSISRLFGHAPIPPSWTGFLAERIAPSRRARPVPFDRELVRRMAGRFICEPEIHEAVLRQIDAILDDDALCLAAVIASWFLFDASEAETDPRRDLIVPTDTVDSSARLFFVPLFLARVPALYDAHARLAIPAADTGDLLADIERWILDYRARHGVIGFDKAGWLYNHFRCRLFQFGRLQFEPSEFGWPFRVFERAAGTESLVLVEAGHEFRGDGQFSGTDLRSHFPPRTQSSAVVGTTTLTIGEDRITGHPVDDRGGILPQTVSILRREWNELGGPGSRVVAVHIPASGPLEPTAVSDSFERAATFFSREPAAGPRAFTCGSWLMDRQLDRYLGPESNIVAFQRRFLPLPLPGATDHQHFERVFGEAPARLDEAPQENTLQRAIVAHIRRGLAWRSAGGVARLAAGGTPIRSV